MGPIEVGAIMLIVLLLFGAKRLPDLGSAFGETAGYVRRKMQDRV